MSCGVGCRRGSDPELLWLWPRPEATAPIRPLAWELPCAAGVALKGQKTKRKKKENIRNILSFFCIFFTHAVHVLDGPAPQKRPRVMEDMLPYIFYLEQEATLLIAIGEELREYLS